MLGHKPVCRRGDESDPKHRRRFIDATLGEVGIRAAILERDRAGRAECSRSIKTSWRWQGDGDVQSFGSRLIMEHSNFKNIAPLAPGTDFSK